MSSKPAPLRALRIAVIAIIIIAPLSVFVSIPWLKDSSTTYVLYPPPSRSGYIESSPGAKTTSTPASRQSLRSRFMSRGCFARSSVGANWVGFT